MDVPTFTYLLRDAPRPETKQRFVAAVLETQRFWRNERSQILFLVSDAPRDWCLVDRRQGFQDICESGEVLKITGDVIEGTWQDLWIWLTAAKWRLPRANAHLPYAPTKPLPISRTGYEFVSARRAPR